jgi:hypothetical protein
VGAGQNHPPVKTISQDPVQKNSFCMMGENGTCGSLIGVLQRPSSAPGFRHELRQEQAILQANFDEKIILKFSMLQS